MNEKAPQLRQQLGGGAWLPGDKEGDNDMVDTQRPERGKNRRRKQVLAVMGVALVLGGVVSISAGIEAGAAVFAALLAGAPLVID